MQLLKELTTVDSMDMSQGEVLPFPFGELELAPGEMYLFVEGYRLDLDVPFSMVLARYGDGGWTIEEASFQKPPREHSEQPTRLSLSDSSLDELVQAVRLRPKKETEHWRQLMEEVLEHPKVRFHTLF